MLAVNAIIKGKLQNKIHNHINIYQVQHYLPEWDLIGLTISLGAI